MTRTRTAADKLIVEAYKQNPNALYKTRMRTPYGCILLAMQNADDTMADEGCKRTDTNDIEYEQTWSGFFFSTLASVLDDMSEVSDATRKWFSTRGIRQ